MAVHGIAIVDADEQLLVAARAGDQDCFARLIEPHIAPGYRLAASMLNDPGEAEDVVQDATGYYLLGTTDGGAHWVKLTLPAVS